MAENNGKASYLWGALAVGIASLFGYGIYRLSKWQEEKEKLRIELFAEYQSEMDELIAYQAALADKGEITESDNQVLDLMMQEITAKELEMERLDRSWIGMLTSDIITLLAAIGLFMVLTPIAGYVGYQVLRRLFRKRPPRDPDYRDPLTGTPVASPEELKEKVEEHSPTTDMGAVLTAQAVFEQQPFWVREVIAAEAGVYDRAHRSWATLSGSEHLALAYGMAFAVGVWIAAPALGPAAALLLVF